MSTTQRYGDLELSFRSNQQVAELGSSLGVYTGYRETTVVPWMSSGFKLGPRGRATTAGVLVLVDRSADNDLLRPPADWHRIGYVSAPNGATMGVWRPVPPPGYVALGDTIWGRDDPPAPGPVAATACVKQGKHSDGWTYVRQGECGTRLYEEGGLRLWSVVDPPYPDGDLDERLYLPCGNFTAVTSLGTPAPTATTWILDLPAVITRRDGPEIPELTSHARPPAQTVITDREVTVPYFLVQDNARDEAWKVANSPFYRLRRKRHYELILYRDNRNGTETQEASEEVTSGVTQERSDAFSVTTGISVGMSVGVTAGAKPFGMGVETTITASISASIEVGYERRTNVAVMNEVKKRQVLVIAPRSSGALWMEFHELLPVRANGDTLGNQAALGFKTDYYVTGQYPSTATVTYYEIDAQGRRIDKPARHLPPDA